MTAEEHYARGMELLKLSERYGDTALWYAMRAQAHFAAATAAAAMRADAGRQAPEETP